MWVDRQAITRVNVTNMVSLRFPRKKVSEYNIYNLYCIIYFNVCTLFCYSGYVARKSKLKVSLILRIVNGYDIAVA